MSLSKLIVAQILTLAIIYLIFSFVKLSFDFREWEEGARVAAAFSWVIFAGFILSIFTDPK